MTNLLFPAAQSVATLCVILASLFFANAHSRAQQEPAPAQATAPTPPQSDQQTQRDQPSQIQQQATEPETAQRLDVHWPSFRGPLGTGEGVDADPPMSWSEHENVKWKTGIRGTGHSTPVVAGNVVVVTSVEPFGDAFEPRADNRPGSHDNLKVSQQQRYLVTAIDRTSGEMLWETVVHENIPHEGGHDTGSLAAASPVTDGQRIYAYFGSHGLLCLDYSGEILWQKEFEPMHSKHGHGEGASPGLAPPGQHELIAINRDQEEQSYLVVYDSRSGEERWKVEREEITSWSSPIFVEHDGTLQLIAAGTNRVRGYNAQDGTLIWECGGLSHNIVATPIHHEGVIIVASSYEIKSLMAIQLEGAEGDLTGTAGVLWQKFDLTPYVPSPLLYGGRLYFLRHYQGILSSVNVEDGTQAFPPTRLRGFREIYASPGAANDALFICSRGGTTAVVSHSDFPRMLSLNILEDSFNASPVFVGNQLILRGEQFVYCIEKD